MYQFTKGRFLPITITVLFVGSTIFFSSAAAQKIIHSTPAKLGQTKGAIKITKAAGKASFSTNDNQPDGMVKAGLPINPDQGQVTIQSTASADNNSQSNQSTADNQNSQNSNTQGSPSQNTQNNQNANSTAVSANTFTLATLAAHNKTGNCYIAYKGKVYDLSNSAAWANCQHNGTKGGIDVTSIFPHPVSYFDALPVVGTFTTSNSQNQNQNNSQGNQNQNTNSTTTPGNAGGPTDANASSTVSGEAEIFWQDDDGDEDDDSDDSFEREHKQAEETNRFQKSHRAQESEED